MSETPIFYAEPAAFGANIVLRGQECTHLVSVLRLGPGSRVRVTDGQGHVALCDVTSASRREACLRQINVCTVPRPASLPYVAIAFSKAARRGFFLEKAVELGAAGIWVFQGDYSQGCMPDNVTENWLAKMIAGCKQCGNPWLPQVRAFPGGLDDAISAAASFEHHILPWERQKGVPMSTLDELGLPGRSIYVIGPEGGFSEREIDVMRAAGYMAVSLGSRILRCETAATLCLGLHWWASQQKGRPDAPQDSMSHNA